MAKLLFFISSFLKIRFIDIDNKPYLERYHVCKTRWFTIYLHRFISSDGDRHLHNHPWRFSLGVLLCGGYIERRSQGLAFSIPDVYNRITGLNRFNLIKRNDFHQIIYSHRETWTLFIHTDHRESYGFLNPVYDVESKQNALSYTEPYANKFNDWHLDAPVAKDTKRTPLHARNRNV